MAEAILVLGSGAIQIAQAGEFDYAGAQALKALKERGFRTLLLNANLASAQTLPCFADRVFALPLNLASVRYILEVEQPVGLMAGFGGQSALNLALELEAAGLLNELPLLGTSLASIRQSEDRLSFFRLCQSLDLPVPRSVWLKKGTPVSRLQELAFPLLHRQSFALGGQGARLYADLATLLQALEPLAGNGLLGEDLFLEEDLSHWQEIEFEVMRDAAGHALVVCAMENIDPVGIHTGDSYVVAPPMTLSNQSYFELRAAALQLANHLGLVGECNVQFAHHADGSYRVIELNPRLSRSSALASKATGYPIAYVAARLALGENLPDIPNPLTGVTSCFFEPALDYVVVKAPRWQFEKFPGADRRLGPEMKSIGESMGLGEDFVTAFAKAWAMTRPSQLAHWTPSSLRQELAVPTDLRLPAILAAFKMGLELTEIQRLTGISPWFLQQLQTLALQPPALPAGGLRQIDTLAGEFPACTPYLYLASQTEFEFGPGPWVLVLGSGPYGIGTSVEFDYCCVSAVKVLQAAGYRVAMLNSNPETLSSDHDLADALIFEALTPQTLNAIFTRLRPKGLIASLGGQLPQNLLATMPPDWPVWGTPVKQILCAENRLEFARKLQALHLPQPAWCAADQLKTALAFGQQTGYPLILRPGFVLGGGGMRVMRDAGELSNWFANQSEQAVGTLLNQFVGEALEFELDGIARQGQLEYYLFSENIEPVGIHSGDSHHVFPAQRLSQAQQAEALDYARQLVMAFEISGLFNLQFLLAQGHILIIEANLRASRNLPFLSHVAEQNLVELAIQRLLASSPLANAPQEIKACQVGLRVPAFSWERMHGARPELGVEMKATGEYCVLAETFEEALAHLNS